MNDSSHLIDGLFVAGFVCLTILGVCLMPTRKWAGQLLGEWAEAQGYRIVKFKDGDLFERIFTSRLQAVYHLQLVDAEGLSRSCKVVIGHWLLGRTIRRVHVSWTSLR